MERRHIYEGKNKKLAYAHQKGEGRGREGKGRRWLGTQKGEKPA